MKTLFGVLVALAFAAHAQDTLVSPPVPQPAPTPQVAPAPQPFDWSRFGSLVPPNPQLGPLDYKEFVRLNKQREQEKLRKSTSFPGQYWDIGFMLAPGPVLGESGELSMRVDLSLETSASENVAITLLGMGMLMNSRDFSAPGKPDWQGEPQEATYEYKQSVAGYLAGFRIGTGKRIWTFVGSHFVFGSLEGEYSLDDGSEPFKTSSTFCILVRPEAGARFHLGRRIAIDANAAYSYLATPTYSSAALSLDEDIPLQNIMRHNLNFGVNFLFKFGHSS